MIAFTRATPLEPDADPLDLPPALRALAAPLFAQLLSRARGRDGVVATPALVERLLEDWLPEPDVEPRSVGEGRGAEDLPAPIAALCAHPDEDLQIWLPGWTAERPLRVALEGMIRGGLIERHLLVAREQPTRARFYLADGMLILLSGAPS